MLRRRTVAILAVLAITAAALSGCGGSSSSGVTPAAYVKAICSAVGPFEKDVQARSSALNLSSIKSAQQGKTALQGFLKAIASDTDAAVSKLKAAGAPNVSNGPKIQSAIVSAFTQLDTAMQKAASSADSLPTASPEAFKTAATTLGNTVKTSMSGIGSSLNGLKSTALEKAAASDPTCKSIGA
jgi:basic membrane lipoprotein Med (substrate-binding protein (PBP1-ABC) superfamily)